MRRKLFSIVLSICMVFTMIPIAGGGTQAYAAVYRIGTVNPTTLNVGDVLYKGVRLDPDKNVTRCEDCHQLWFVSRADSKSVALKQTTEHNGHNVGWSSFSWYTSSAEGFTADTPYTVMENVYNVTGYTITYNTNGGNAISSVSNATKLPNPLPISQKNGYDFVGWYTDAGLTISATPGAALTGNITLYAKWNLHSHSFSDEWSKNDGYHWHAATCGHSTEKGSYGEHVYGTTGDTRYVCTTCNYTNTVRQANIEAADTVATLINAIGTVEYTDNCKTKIDEAREAYNKLTNEQKAFVNNESTLTGAETAYANLKAAAEKEAADTAAVAAAVAKIEAIGKVEYTNESKAKINAARTAYDALTDDQKVKVTEEQFKILTDAETAYANLEATAEKEAADQKAANAVIALIDAIGNVEYTDESKAKIDEARAAYDVLTDDQKVKVTADKRNILTDAEAAYANLKATAEKEAADQKAANAVIALIDAIGNVEYTDASKAKIDEAREAYDKLTDDQKQLVNNYSTLTEAEKRYKELANTRPGGHYKPTQKPEIIAEEGSQGGLTLNGTKVTITVEEGYELVDVLVNGISKGKVTELTGLKTGDKVEIKTEKIPEKLEPQAVKNIVKELKLVARSERLSNGNVRIKVTKITDINDNPVDLNELEKNGYTVKFKYYRSVKKSAGYDTRLEKDADINSYINNFGDKGTKYYYKVKVMVYDADGNLVAQSSLNQCKYAMRVWIK